MSDSMNAVPLEAARVVRVILYEHDEFTIDGSLRWEHGGRCDDMEKVTCPGAPPWQPRGIGGAKRDVTALLQRLGFEPDGRWQGHPLAAAEGSLRSECSRLFRRQRPAPEVTA